jgi:PPK2 family polyphosphate:nucleotide phosphotransferase
MDIYRVKPGSKVDLSQIDPEDQKGFKGDKKAAEKHLLNLSLKLEKLQEMVYAEHKHAVLIVLQGMDTSGKDGTIRHVFESVDPLGVRVASFKEPTPEELAHDFLWRINKQLPAKGETAIFNRSHYEDVLVVRVHNLVPREVWSKRYEDICAFEKHLVDEGTTILKFFLYIDDTEQKKRLQGRLDDPSKHWKFNEGDLKERAMWDEYMKAYEVALTKTSTDWAPWFIVPSNVKWYRNLVVATTIMDTLEKLHMHYPSPKIDVTKLEAAL